MAIAETAQLAVLLTLKDQMSGGLASAEAQLGVLNRTAGTSGPIIAKTGGAMAGLKVAATGMAGGLNHAKSAIGGLISGPLGMIGLGAGLFTIGGVVTGSVKKLEDFTLALEAVQGLTGETAQSAGALILQFEKFGLSGDRITQIAGFAEKTLGKLNETQAKGTAATKSAALVNLELVKAQRQAAGESTKVINGLITEQTARDKLAAAHATGSTSLTKLQALDKVYGLSLVDTKGKVVSFSEELAQMATFYDSGASASTKAYVASQVFGRGYASLVPILAQGGAGIRQAAADAAALGLNLGGDTVSKMNKFRDQMRTLGEQANILQMRIGLALIPTFSDWATKTGAWLSSGGSEQIVGFFKDATKFAGTMGEALKPIVGIFGAIVSGFNKLPDFAKAALVGTFVANKATNAIFGTGLKGIAGGVGNVLSAMRGASPASPVFVSDVGKGIGGLAGGAAGAAEGIGLAAVVTAMIPVLLAGAAGAAIVQFVGGFDPTKAFGPKGGGTGRVGGFASAPGGPGGSGGASGPRVAAAYGLGLPRVSGSAHPVESGDVRDAAYYLATHIGIDIANAVRHAKLNAEIGKKGGAFLRAGDAAGQKTMDANAGKLVQLFQTSTNPSLVSLKANMANMIVEQRKHPTDKVLGNDIIAMKIMITNAINALPGAIAALGGVNFTQTAAQQRNRQGADPVNVHVTSQVSSNTIARNKAVVQRSGGLRSLGGNISMAGGG